MNLACQKPLGQITKEVDLGKKKKTVFFLQNSHIFSFFLGVSLTCVLNSRTRGVSTKCLILMCPIARLLRRGKLKQTLTLGRCEVRWRSRRCLWHLQQIDKKVRQNNELHTKAVSWRKNPHLSTWVVEKIDYWSGTNARTKRSNQKKTKAEYECHCKV